MKAVGNYLIIQKVESKTKETKGGLLLSEASMQDVRYVKAKIVDPGEQQLKKDDLIFYDKVAGHKIDYDDQQYIVIKVQDVVVVL
jgi:chaperonin GroES|tara:strand:+ start:3265 stop:3519 length:255 start_codon:yes stop_codon:yes gene_type:complete